MIIIPAIDIKDGRCVRLEQGRMDAETIYSEDPVSVALKWQEQGAELIHIVDLDAAIEGHPVNFERIAEIAKAVDTPIQIGGGIRDKDGAERYLALDGVKRIIIGTAAFKEPELLKGLAREHSHRIAVGIDAKDGRVAIKGWVEVTELDAVELVKSLNGLALACIIYTDISRDGMLSGPNVEATERLIESTDIPVVASGGVSGVDDIIALGKMNLEGVIVGKALYSGNINLEEAIKASKGI